MKLNPKSKYAQKLIKWSNLYQNSNINSDELKNKIQIHVYYCFPLKITQDFFSYIFKSELEL